MTEQQYDKIHNEGYTDGYNPIREARIRREMEAEAARPKTIDEQMDAIRHQISIRDCSVARESGTFNQAEIDELRRTLKEMQDKDDNEFLADWPLEITKAKRATWNEMVRAEKFGAGRVDLKLVHATEQEQGWTLKQLRRAVKIHNL